MYNEKIKKRFLEENDLLENTRRTYGYILTKASEFESEIVEGGKNIYDMTPYECDQLINAFSRRSEGVIFVIITCLKQYVDFAKVNNLIENDAYNYFSTLTGIDTIRKYLDKTADENKYISYEQLIEMESYCLNAQDAVIPELLFVGIKGDEASELLELKQDCIFPDKIVLSDREIPISQRTYQLIQDAINQDEYHNGNGDTTGKAKTRPINDSDYVLKPAGTHLQGQITYAAFQARVIKIKNYFDNPYLSPTNIWTSGMIHVAKQIKEEKGELTREDYQYINKLFGIAHAPWSQTKFRIDRFVG